MGVIAQPSPFDKQRCWKDGHINVNHVVETSSLKVVKTELMVTERISIAVSITIIVDDGRWTYTVGLLAAVATVSNFCSSSSISINITNCDKELMID